MNHPRFPSAEEAKAASIASSSLDDLLDCVGTSVRSATKVGRYDCHVDPWLTRRFNRDTVLAAVKALEAVGYSVDVKHVEETHGMIGCFAIYVGWGQPFTQAPFQPRHLFNPPTESSKP